MSVKDELKKKYGGGAGVSSATSAAAAAATGRTGQTSTGPSPVRQDAAPKKDYSIAKRSGSVRDAMKEKYGGDTSQASVERYRERMRRTAEEGLNKYRRDRSARDSGSSDSSLLSSLTSAFARNPDIPVGAYDMAANVERYRNDTSWMEPGDDWDENYLLEFGRLYGYDPEEAGKYASQVNNYLNAMKRQAQEQAVGEEATKGFWSSLGATGKSILTAPLGFGDFLDNVAEYAGRGTITEKPTLTPFGEGQAATAAIAKKLNENGGTLDEDIPVIGGKGWGDVYSLGTSTAQSIILGNTLGKAGTLMTFFGSAAASGIQDAKSRGAEDDRAIAYGLASGLSEVASEYIPLGDLLDAGAATGWKDFIINIVKQGAEEFIGEGANSVATAVADRLILGDKSEFSRLVQDGLASGLDEKAAQKRAILETVENVAFDALGGFVTGGVSMGLQQGAQTMRYGWAPQNVPDVAATEESSVVPDADTEETEQAEPVETHVETVEERAENAQSSRTIEEVAQDFGEQAGAAKHYYQEGQDPEQYGRAFRAAYDMGKSGVGEQYAVNSEAAAYLTEEQRHNAWLTGKGAAALEAQRAAKSNAAKATGGTVRKKGTVRAEGVTLQELQAGFNDRQKSAYSLLTSYAEATGVDVVLYRSQADEDGNFQGAQGSYHWDSSTIHLDVNAGLSRGTDVGTLSKYTMMKTYSHEFTHFGEQWSPEKYDTLRQEVFRAMEESGESPADLIEELMAANSGMSYDEASREVVAEAMVDILEDSDFIQRIARTDKTLFEKIREKLAQFVGKIRDYWKGMVTTNSRGAVAVKRQIGEDLKYLEHIQSLWDEMAADAVESYQQSVMNVAEATSEQARQTAAEENAQEAQEEKPAEPAAEETSAREYARSKGYRLELNKMSAAKGMTQVDIYDKQNLPTVKPVIINETSDWNKVTQAIERHEESERRKAEPAAETVETKEEPTAEAVQEPVTAEPPEALQKYIKKFGKKHTMRIAEIDGSVDGAEVMVGSDYLLFRIDKSMAGWPGFSGMSKMQFSRFHVETYMNGANKRLTEQPMIGTHDKAKIVEFDTPEGKMFFKWDLLRYLDGNELYYNYRAKSIKAVDPESGKLVGFVLGMKLDGKNIQDKKPGKMKSFSNAVKPGSVEAAPAEALATKPVTEPETEAAPMAQADIDRLVEAGGKLKKIQGKQRIQFGPWLLLDRAAKLGYDVDKNAKERLKQVKSWVDPSDGSIHSGDELLKKTLERIVQGAETIKEDKNHGSTEEQTPRVLEDRPVGAGDSGVSGERAAENGSADDGRREPVGVPEPGERQTGRDDADADAGAEAPGESGEGDRQGGVPDVTEAPQEAEPEKPAKKPRKKPAAKKPAPAAEAVQEQVERVSTEEPGGNNWVIGESLELPEGDAAKTRTNLEAIRIIKRLEASGQNATAAEQATLAKYVGWGGLSSVFDERNQQTTQTRSELKELLTDEEYRNARASTNTAFYTDVGVIRAMYDGLKSLGFTGGRVLEPAAGVGHFAGAMPADVRAGVRSMTMVELDTITGRIAKHLYPGMDVRVEGFENTILPDGYMDAAVGNVPFGNFAVVDKNYPKKITAAIHNYFFAKTLDKVRPGGIVMMITSRHTMDSGDSTVREYIGKKADLLGAIRLPNTAFKGGAGTEVVSDILILKKRAPGTAYTGQEFTRAEWTYFPESRHSGAVMNTYFRDHPEMVLGTNAMARGRYGSELTVNPREGDLGQQIREAFARIEGRMDYPTVQTVDRQNFAVERAAGKPKSGGYTVKDGKLLKNENGKLVETGLDEKTKARLTGMVGIREAARKLQNAQKQGLNADTIRKARKELNKLYDEFVAKYGYLNAAANRSAIREDPDRYSLLALEHYDADTRSAVKADIFTKNTIAPNRTVTSAGSVAEGLIVSRNQTGGVDVELIARLTGKTAEEVTRELIDTRMAFKTRDGSLEAAETYLSGNVRAKLREAQGLAPIDADFRNNVEALTPIIPKDIPHTEIHVNPGATWVPAGVYADFAAEMLGDVNSEYRTSVKITYHPQTGGYSVELMNHYLKINARNTQKWGAGGKTFIELLEAMLNSKTVTVWRKQGDTRVVDETATNAANEKVEAIGEEFRKWLWKDEARRAELGKLYNEQFNCLVNPSYNGENLTINGMNAAISLRPHQLNAVQRVVSSGGNTLLAHRVGAGKTFEMAAAAMKLKELGLVKKPMFAVPKSLVAQWGKEFADLFPTARLMVAEAGDFTPENRRVFANRIANGDYDAVIVSYEQFEKLPISVDFSKRLYQEQVDSIMDAIAEAKADAGKKASVKDLERTRKSLENKIKKLTDSAKDDDIRFEELGVDALFVDEAHNFKNLFYTTSMTNVAGLGNKDGSKRAFDLYTKVRYLQQLNGGKGIVFATATPVMNSMSEMYIMQRYLQPDLLRQLGLENFDAWAKQFGEVVNGVEIKPSGQGYRVKQSFSRFKNLPELQLLYRNMADVMTQVPGLKIPKMKGGKVNVVECEPGQFQKDYMNELTNRADHIKGVDPSVDNMLKITSDGRKVSYTQRMIDPSLPHEEGCKLYRCADNVLEVWKKTRKDKGTQMIFLDMATPKGKAKADAAETEDGMDMESARLYEDLRARLIEGGIPAKEIAFIHDADTDVKKKKLFQSVNDGNVRVLIGSTGKMGVGMNAQRRAVAIHHLDAPWRPGDVEQRNGRVYRQGNQNKEVECFTYVTVGSFDARLWDILERKQGFIDQVMEGGDVGREAEDTGEVTLSAAEVKALASGSPLILEQVQLETKIKKLESLRRAHYQAVQQTAVSLAANQSEVRKLEGYIEKAGKDLARRTDAYMDKKFSMTIGKKVYRDVKEAGVALMAAAQKAATMSGYTTVGTFAGFDVRVVKTAEGIQGMLSGNQGYTFKTYPGNTTHMINVMRSTAEGIEATRKAWQNKAERLRADISEQEKLAGKPFEKEAQLAEARARYREVMRLLTPGNEQRLDGLDSGEEKQQAQARRAELTDREVLELAVDKLDRDSMTDAERTAVDIIYTKLRGLEGLEARRQDLGRRYKEQQFGAKVDRTAAATTLAQMKELDAQIAQAENAVLEGDSATLKSVLRKARTVVRDQERQHGQDILKRYRDRRNNAADIRKYRERIKKDTKEMMDWVLKPDGKNVMKHIPQVIREAVLPFLESIDMTSKQQLRGGEATRADSRYLERLEAMRDRLHDTDMTLYTAYDLPPDFLEKLDRQLKAVRDIVGSSSGGVLNEMTASELKELSGIVKNLKKFIQNFNRFHANAMMQHVYEAGDSTIEELRPMAADNGRTGSVRSFLYWQQIRPAYAFERFGTGGKAVWDGLRRGQSKLAFLTKQIQEFSEKTWTAKQVKDWESEILTLDLGGDTVRMTVADAMSFYELSKRPQALTHILGEGGRVATRTRKMGEKKNQRIVDTGHQFTLGDVETIRNALTEEQKRVADAMQQFMAKTGGRWGNEVSMRRFGEEQFGEDTYFPISVDNTVIDATVDEKPNSASLYSLLNMGFTKALTPNAKNRIVVYSIFDVFAAHMGEMASYNAMALPVLDAVKWLNYQQDEENGGRRVRDELRRVYGAPGEGGGKAVRGYAEKFIVNILRGFNGTEAQASPNDGFGMTMLHRYNRAQVAFNLRSAIQQPTSIVRAGMILDVKSILHGIGSIAVVKKNIAEMQRYSGIAAWKGLGFYDVNISRGLNAIIKQDGGLMEKVTDFGLKGAELGDTVTWAAIWYACKSKVVHSGTKMTDESFFPKVTELFEEVIYKTQVVDSILTKSEYMRDKGFFSRLTSSFMGEPVTSASMLLDTMQKIDADRNAGAGPGQLLRAHGAELARRTAVYSLSGLLTVAAASLVDALRDDDDYQSYWEKWEEAFTEDIGGELNPLGKLPLISDVWDVVKAVYEQATGGDPWVQVANLPMADIASYAIKGVEILRDKILGEDTNYTWYGGVYKLLQALGGAAGAPMSALTRDVIAVWNSVVGYSAPSLKIKTYDSGEKNEIKFAYKDGWLSESEATELLLSKEIAESEDEAYWLIREWDNAEDWSRYDALTEAIIAGESTAAALDELTAHGYDADDAASEVKSRIGKLYQDGGISRQDVEKALRNSLFEMDAEEIKQTVDKWSCKVVTGIAYGDIKDAYLDGEITVGRAAQMRQLYGGETAAEAEETVREWRAEKETGVAYGDIADAFRKGKLTKAQAKQMYITYGGLSEEDAAQKTEVLAFVKENPGCEGISYAAVESYRETCEGTGVKPGDYYKVWKFNSTAQADVDESGKSISGSKKRKVLEYIDSMNLTNAQKDSLYYAFGWAKSTIGEAPWH